MSRLVKKTGSDGWTSLKRVNKQKKSATRVGMDSNVTTLYNDFDGLSSDSDSGSDWDLMPQKRKPKYNIQPENIDYTRPQVGIRLDLPEPPKPKKKKKKIRANEPLDDDDADWNKGGAVQKRKKKPKKKQQQSHEQEKDLGDIICEYLLSLPTNFQHESIIAICNAALPEGKTWKRYYSKLPQYRKYKKFNAFVRTLDGERVKVEEEHGTLVLWKPEPWAVMDAERKKRAAKKARQKAKRRGVALQGNNDKSAGKASKSSGCGCCGSLVCLLLVLAVAVGVYLYTFEQTFDELVSMLNERARSIEAVRGAMDKAEPVVLQFSAQLRETSAPLVEASVSLLSKLQASLSEVAAPLLSKLHTFLDSASSL